ncbi:unnamed protein product [Clonostachys byssicola]|uniref:Uncharacterized protein n=1 Tax=Clonostachys byssicola TaxID=160290 RepID=A0A9N9TXS6_9HYPO|nr:unnamed protein product [Clonostachys byssicola]
MAPSSLFSRGPRTCSQFIRIWVPLTRPLRLGPFFCFCIFSDKRSKPPHGGDTGSFFFLFHSFAFLFRPSDPRREQRPRDTDDRPLRIIITSRARLREVADISCGRLVQGNCGRGLFAESTRYLPENHTALANSPLPPIEFVQPSLLSH